MKFPRNAGAIRLLRIHHSAAQVIARHFRIMQILRSFLKRVISLMTAVRLRGLFVSSSSTREKAILNQATFPSNLATPMSVAYDGILPDQPVQASLALRPGSLKRKKLGEVFLQQITFRPVYNLAELPISSQ